MICQPLHPMSHSYQCRTLPLSPLLPWLRFGRDEQYQKKENSFWSFREDSSLHLPLLRGSNPSLFDLLLMETLNLKEFSVNLTHTRTHPQTHTQKKSPHAGRLTGRGGDSLRTDAPVRLGCSLRANREQPHYLQSTDRESLAVRKLRLSSTPGFEAAKGEKDTKKFTNPAKNRRVSCQIKTAENESFAK